jgi:RimJ/RimL family protein N-acetyltransferase
MTMIETSRLVLRPPTLADAPAIARYLNNFAVAGNLARVPYPYRLADAEAWLNAFRPDRPKKSAEFGIELPGAGYVGQIGLDAGDGAPELGYWLGEPFWHRGLMTEAAAAVLDWLFTTTETEFVRSGVFYFNKASLAVQRKLGFVETGESTRHCLARHEDVRHIDTELSRANWAATGRRSGAASGWAREMRP